MTELRVLPVTMLSACKAAVTSSSGCSVEVLKTAMDAVLSAPGLTVLDESAQRIAFADGIEAIFTVATDERPHPRHAQTLARLGIKASLPFRLRDWMLRQLSAGQRVMAPVTPRFALGLLRAQSEAVVTGHHEALELLSGLPEAEADGVLAPRDGVVGEWNSGPWRLVDMEAASRARTAQLVA